MKDLFVLMYNDGKFVQRDDSTGPMATGGYPFRVDDIEDATTWDSAAKAAEYAMTSDWAQMQRKVYKLSFVLGDAIEYPGLGKWTGCNHHCVKSKETTTMDAKHYLDCPVWKDLLAK